MLQIEKSDTLRSRVSRLNGEAQSACRRLLACAQAGPDRDRFERIVGRVRHNTAFHYADGRSDRLFAKMLEVMAERLGSRKARLARGTDFTRWRFHVADDLLLSTVWHHIWGLPVDASDDELRNLAQEQTSYAFGLSLDLLAVCEELVCSYLEDHA